MDFKAHFVQMAKWDWISGRTLERYWQAIQKWLLEQDFEYNMYEHHKNLDVWTYCVQKVEHNMTKNSTPKRISTKYTMTTTLYLNHFDSLWN